MERPPLSRTSALALLIGGLGLCGVAAALAWPSSRPGLDCPPERVRWVGEGSAGIAACDGPGGPVPAGPAMTLRLKLPLNAATAEELALVSGIGPALAKVIVTARRERGAFATWEEVDALPGIGPSKLQALREAFALGEPAHGADAGASP